MEQRPSIGRIVLYRARAPEKDCMYPAIITRVWNDEMVNLEVFGSAEGPDSVQGRYPTSIKRGDERGQWCWPPRV